MRLDPWIATIASDVVFGLLAWFRYETSGQPESWCDRRFWLTAALPVFLFSTATHAITSAVTG